MSELRRITEQYRLDKLVRSSPSGSVFRATDLRTNATVAVKLVVGDDASGDPEEQRERFLQTARTLQALRHPAVPAVLDFGFTTAGSAFLVTEYLHGSSLEVFVGERPARVLPLVILVVSGLEALEEQGLAHLCLGVEHVIVTPGPQGEQVKLLGLGGSALRSAGGAAASPEARRTDLRDLAQLACRLLGVPMPDQGPPVVEIPAKVAREIERPDLLCSLLTRLLQPDAPEPPPSYEEVRQALRVALAGETEWKTEVFMDPSLSPPSPAPAPASLSAQDVDKTAVLPRTERPPSAVPPAPPPLPAPAPAPPVLAPVLAPPAPTQAVVVPKQRPRWLLPLAGVAMVALVAAGLAVLPGKRDRTPEPAAATPEPAVTPAATMQPPPATPAAPRVHPLIERAEAALAAGDPEGARAALAAIPSQERAALSVPELDRLRKVESVLPPPRREQLIKELTAALRAGDLRRLRAAVAAFRPEDREGLAAGVRKDLEKAVQIVGADGRLSAAERGGRPLEILRLAGELSALAPSSSHARAARENAAAAVEAEADTAFAAGQLDAALASLESLRAAWPERPGLDNRIGRIQAERREAERLETSLAAAEREGKANRPQEGLKLLAGAQPNPRFEERFRKARASLESQLARLDQAPPEVTVRGNLPEYEKGKSIRIPLRITDDYGVVSTELWVRTEGGPYQKLPLRHTNESDYEIEITADFHQNKAVELYVQARDYSGHPGQLGTPAAPLKLKRKWWKVF